MVKRIQISDDDVTYYTLPGNSGELNSEAGELNDTIFGQEFSSGETGLINWSISSNAVYKGFAGYIVDLLKGGTPVTLTDEPMELVSGKTYRITDATKRILDFDTAITVEDNSVDETAEIVSINYLAGTITFDSGHTVTGPVTLSGKYVPTTAIAGAKSFTLSQTADTVDETDIPTAKANDGHMVYAPGLKTATLELSGVYKLSNGFKAALVAREPIYVKINPDNANLSSAIGLFKYMGQGQSGDVGALEEETVSLRLSVPDNALMETPFTWVHNAGTTLNQGIQICLDAWLAGDLVYVKYLDEGTAGNSGQAVVTDISLSGGLEAMNEFTVNLQGSGELGVES